VTRDAAGLYEKFGYTRIPPERLWMEKVGPKERWQEPAAH
jgi:predicted N-acetyltransferase YhbS